MSKTLLKRSLDIVEGSSSNTHTSATNSKRQTARNPFAPPSSHQQHSEFRVIKKSANQAKAKSRNAAAGKQKATQKSAIEVAHEHIRNGQNRADLNLKKLLMFSSVKLDEETTSKLVRRAQNRKYVIPEKKPAADAGESVFTDEDFAKFEREYFCS